MASNRYNGVNRSISGTWPVNNANWEVERFALKVFQWHCGGPFIDTNNVWTRVCVFLCVFVFFWINFILSNGNKWRFVLTWTRRILCIGVKCSSASAWTPHWSSVDRVRRSQIFFVGHHNAWSDQSFGFSEKEEIRGKRVRNLWWQLIVQQMDCMRFVFNWLTDINTGRIFWLRTHMVVHNNSCVAIRAYVHRSIFSDNRSIRPNHSQPHDGIARYGNNNSIIA